MPIDEYSTDKTFYSLYPQSGKYPLSLPKLKIGVLSFASYIFLKLMKLPK